MDTGLCPNSSRDILEGVFLRSRISSQVHTRLLVLLGSGALLRGDGGEGRPALFYLVTTAVWAGGLFSVMFCHGQNLREGLLAGVAGKLIVGHTDLPRSWNDYSWILDRPLEQVQHGVWFRLVISAAELLEMIKVADFFGENNHQPIGRGAPRDLR
jgi:hypothetical protein